MEFRCVLFLSLAMLCLGKPAKRSADESSDGSQVNAGASAQATSNSPSGTTGTETSNSRATSAKKMCPGGHECVAEGSCSVGGKSLSD